MSRIAQSIDASERDKQELLIMSRSHKPDSRYVLRSGILLYSPEGKSLDEISVLTGSGSVIINNGEVVFAGRDLQV